MLSIALTNHDLVVRDTSIITKYFHEKCVKMVLQNPEKYDNSILTIALVIPDYLKEIQRSYELNKNNKERIREEIIQEAKQANLGLFLDEATGKITFGKENK
jgi:hypothetical protein